MSRDTDDQTLTAKEVCDEFRISEHRLKEFREAGLPYVRLPSGRRKYLRRDVRAFIQSLRVSDK